MTEIGPELFPARKALTPGPWLPHFGHREFIERNLRIHPCAGIAIPVPDAARIGRRIDQQHVEPGVTQLVEQVDPAEAGTDDHGVVIGRSLGRHDAAVRLSAIAFAVAYSALPVGALRGAFSREEGWFG